MARQELAIEGMHCSSCSMLIDDALEDLPGVKSSATNVRRRRCVVDYEPGQVGMGEIMATIEELGYRAAPVGRK
jgi:copper chaperone CopZ